MPSAKNRPGLAASPELTKLTAESGPATLPSPIVCKDKRDADRPTPGRAGGHWERQLTPAAQPAASPGPHPGLDLSKAWSGGGGEILRDFSPPADGQSF